MRNVQFWTYWLADHPNKDFVSKIKEYLTVGIDICYNGPTHQVLSSNWPSAEQYRDEVLQFIQENLQLGAVAGPLDPPPGYRASPLGAFQRKSSKKVRVIHDLSWPPGDSVNDFIPSSECSVKYVTVENVANLCMLYQEPWLVKMDLRAAFL